MTRAQAVSAAAPSNLVNARLTVINLYKKLTYRKKAIYASAKTSGNLKQAVTDLLSIVGTGDRTGQSP